MEFGFLRDLVLVFGLSLVVVVAFSRLRLPPTVGFLLTGVIVGPHGLKLVQDQHNVETLAEVGVVVLLFAIGVELSLGELLRLGRPLLIGGGLQTGLTLTIAAAAARLLGLAPGPAVIAGFVVALSSTAIVMKLLVERAEASSPHGRLALSILIFQDLAVVPMMLAIPFLRGGSPDLEQLAWTAFKGVVVLAAVPLVARRLLPRALGLVVATRSNELFVLSIVAVCLGTAWITAEAGLSLALGAFLAGLVVAESEYSHQALAIVLPFRDAFISLFFVSVGMLFDLGAVAARPLTVALLTAAIVLLKALVVLAVVVALGYPARIALRTALFLAQVGEFSFLLLAAAAREQVLAPEVQQGLIAATVATMALSPALGKLADWLPARLPARLDRRPPEAAPEHVAMGDHVIVVGYGVNGQNLTRALQRVGMGYVILEVNPETVQRLRAQGEPILHGDATQAVVLCHAGVERARIVVTTVPDAAAARRVVELVRRLNPQAHQIVRTRFVREVPELYRLGANEVVPEEFETSVELLARVLRSYLVPKHIVDRLVRETREKGYEMFRTAQVGTQPIYGLQRLLGNAQMEAYMVEADSELAGRTMAESQIRSRTGALILGVHRDNRTTPNPPPDWRFAVDDVALVLGTGEALALVAPLFAPAAEA